METGFIILRHVNSEKTDKYWKHSYDCVRQFYPESPILIIDDNSEYMFIDVNKDLYLTTIVNSEFPRRGEFLPYYYFLKLKPFDIAVIIHDSVFINSHLNLSVNKFRSLWEFEHQWDQIKDETQMINIFNDPNLSEFHRNKKAWKGCFGAMSIITHEHLTNVNKKYDIKLLIPLIETRYNRCSFERVIACLMNAQEPSLLGNIHKYITWGVPFEYKDDFKALPVIKVWTGR
jgi:hypothetical protein